MHHRLIRTVLITLLAIGPTLHLNFPLSKSR